MYPGRLLVGGQKDNRIHEDRLDKVLVTRGLVKSRQRAQAFIMEGKVWVDGKRVDKSGARIAADAEVVINGEESPYVSRGGVKLEKALDRWKIEVSGKNFLDVGASTGGFSDCLLQRGAARVYAVDVGYGQLAWKIKCDERVISLERSNIRYLSKEKFKDELDILVDWHLLITAFFESNALPVLPFIFAQVLNNEWLAVVYPQ